MLFHVLGFLAVSQVRVLLVVVCLVVCGGDEDSFRVCCFFLESFIQCAVLCFWYVNNV